MSNNLTPRELEVLRELATGQLNKEIAINLGISDQTVKNHIVSIYKKLDVGNRVEATLRAVGMGVITVDVSGKYNV